jgi:hypothetical protein
VRGLPTSFVVGRDAVVPFREIGYRDWTDAGSQFIVDQAPRPRRRMSRSKEDKA